MYSVCCDTGSECRSALDARDRSLGVEHYGASADYQTLYRQFGITAAAVTAAARDSIHDAQNGTRPGGHPATFAPAAGGTADRPA